MKITVFNVIIKENPEDAALATAQTRGEKSSEKTSVETSVKTSVETPAKTPDRILSILASHPEMTLAQVSAEIGKSQRAIEMACAKLIQAKLLKHKGPKKGGHWEVIKKE